jgi:2-oxoisovalerate dehydrogenase E1 component alpha subunit
MSAREVRAEARHVELGLSDQDVLQMYYYMVLARSLDERMWQLQRAGKAMFVISGPGHEGAQVGMTWPLDRERDWFVPYYRSVAAVLVKGMTPTDILLAVLAKATDPSSGGRQMPGHYAHPRYRILSTSSPVGTQYPHAAGLAYAAKLRKTGEVVLVTIGDGGTSQGDWHEALNFAAIHKVPCLFAVENNRYAISVPLHKQMAVPSVAVRAAGYGMPGVSVDGSDVLECYRAAKEAYDRAKRGEGPTLLEFRVERLGSHSSDDQQERYRPREEIETARQRDPIPAFRRYLESVGLWDDEQEQALRDRVRREVDAATDEAERAPDPDPATASRHVYYEPDPDHPTDPVWWTGR